MQISGQLQCHKKLDGEMEHNTGTMLHRPPPQSSRDVHQMSLLLVLLLLLCSVHGLHPNASVAQKKLGQNIHQLFDLTQIRTELLCCCCCVPAFLVTFTKPFHALTNTATTPGFHFLRAGPWALDISEYLTRYV